MRANSTYLDAHTLFGAAHRGHNPSAAVDVGVVEQVAPCTVGRPLSLLDVVGLVVDVVELRLLVEGKIDTVLLVETGKQQLRANNS